MPDIMADLTEALHLSGLYKREAAETRPGMLAPTIIVFVCCMTMQCTFEKYTLSGVKPPNVF